MLVLAPVLQTLAGLPLRFDIRWDLSHVNDVGNMECCEPATMTGHSRVPLIKEDDR
jgi:hypothetical protein